MPPPPSIQESDGTVRQGQDVPPASVSTLDVDDPQLSFIRVDFQLRLRFGATEVVIGTPFTLALGGDEVVLDPEEPSSLGPALGLFPGILSALAISPDGSLRLDFDGGARLTVPPHASYEAWQVAGPGTRLVVCGPGGSRLSCWP